MKKDVENIIQLPEKTEQVFFNLIFQINSFFKILFCDITTEQRKLYLDYLNSKECNCILKKKMDSFVGLITLRKLCNHPDLINGKLINFFSFITLKKNIYIYFNFSLKKNLLNLII